ncbi:MAG: VOC family protein [Actinobacteria bacterium]|nr:VOC family protein [Actinomycetota bacterium]MCB8997718.1 VOC family protein [Actinomycetota bacterium]HRY10598.1 VOC family protein [Candidatus Nanopelagicales bacterium]
MRIADLVTVFDAADIETESAFWAGLLDGTVVKEADWHSIRTADGRRLAVQLAPNHTPPDWPDGSPQQMHVDLWVEDLDTAEREVLARGGRLLKAVDAEGFRVYADPAGHPFCLCPH